MGADAVQEVAVMGDDDHRAVSRVEHILQPADGMDIQVVGRLVQQQDVRVGKQRLGQQHPQLPAGGDGAHGALVLFDRDTHAQQQFAGTRLGGVAVVFGKLHLQVRHLHAVLFAHLRQRIDAIALGLHLPQLFMAHDHGIEDRVFLKAELILAQLAEALVGVEADIAGARFQVAAEDLHQRRLAAAVGADKPVAVAVAELDGDVFKKRLGAELHGDIGGG